MKIDSIKHAEPTVMVELTLTEVKILRDTIGVIDTDETARGIRNFDGLDVHPNYQEYIYRMYEEFGNMIQEMVSAASPSERNYTG